MVAFGSLGFQPWIAGGNYILDFSGVWLPFGLVAFSRGSREATIFLISMEYGCLLVPGLSAVDRGMVAFWSYG